MAAKLKQCQEIMPPNKIMMRDNIQEMMTANNQQHRRKHITVQKSASPSLKSFNGSLNASRLSVTNDMDDSLASVVGADTPHRTSTAI